MKKTEIRITGLGGQGVVLAGQILGRAAVYDGKNAVQTQSYGAEARGSVAKSEVIVSDGKIGFPVVRKCDALVAMTQETAEKNIKDLKEDGVLLVDSGLVKNTPETKARTFRIQITQAAEKNVGEKLYANMVMLGALTQIINVVAEEAMEKAIVDSFPKKTVDTNLKAYKIGRELAESL